MSRCPECQRPLILKELNEGPGSYVRCVCVAIRSYDQDQETIKALVDAITNTRTTLAIMSMPRLDDSVARDAALLKIMDDSFEAALATKKGE